MSVVFARLDDESIIQRTPSGRWMRVYPLRRVDSPQEVGPVLAARLAFHRGLSVVRDLPGGEDFYEELDELRGRPWPLGTTA